VTPGCFRRGNETMHIGLIGGIGPASTVFGEFRREVQHPGQICYGSDTQRETVLSCQITRI
jgi:hypothetical protein